MTTNSTGSSHTSKQSLLTALRRERAVRRTDDPHAWHIAHRMIRGEPPRVIPAVAEIMRDRHDLVVVQKSAQAGISEALTSLALWAADTMYARRGHVLYVMPTMTQMDDFTQSRIDSAIQDSVYLRRRLQPEPPNRKGADSKRLKRIGTGYLYLRASESKRQLTSVDADLVNEYDFMPQETLKWAQTRLASSRGGQVILASTPTYPEAGVNGLFLRSDRRRYLLTCRTCSLEQPLDWPDNVDLDHARVVCRDCRSPIDVTWAGRWEATAPGNSRVHGYHLNRLYSPWANLSALIEDSEGFTVAEQQQFMNFSLGETFVPPGGGVTLDDLDRCREDYRLDEYAGQPCVMGVDVGTRLHVVVREHLTDGERNRTGRLWFADAVAGFEELAELARKFNVEMTVIDAQPETRKAKEYQRAHEGVWLARYHQGAETDWDGSTGTVHLDRTEVLDEFFDGVRGGLAALPIEARTIGGGRMKDGVGEYYREVMAPQRTLVPDASGNLTARWTEGHHPDHFAHAEVYCMVAGKRGVWDGSWFETSREAEEDGPVFAGIWNKAF